VTRVPLDARCVFFGLTRAVPDRRLGSGTGRSARSQSTPSDRDERGGCFRGRRHQYLSGARRKLILSGFHEAALAAFGAARYVFPEQARSTCNTRLRRPGLHKILGVRYAGPARDRAVSAGCARLISCCRSRPDAGCGLPARANYESADARSTTRAGCRGADGLRVASGRSSRVRTAAGLYGACLWPQSRAAAVRSTAVAPIRWDPATIRTASNRDARRAPDPPRVGRARHLHGLSPHDYFVTLIQAIGRLVDSVRV